MNSSFNPLQLQSPVLESQRWVVKHIHPRTSERANAHSNGKPRRRYIGYTSRRVVTAGPFLCVVKHRLVRWTHRLAAPASFEHCLNRLSSQSTVVLAYQLADSAKVRERPSYDSMPSCHMRLVGGQPPRGMHYTSALDHLPTVKPQRWSAAAALCTSLCALYTVSALVYPRP